MMTNKNGFWSTAWLWSRLLVFVAAFGCWIATQVFCTILLCTTAMQLSGAVLAFVVWIGALIFFHFFGLYIIETAKASFKKSIMKEYGLTEEEYEKLTGKIR